MIWVPAQLVGVYHGDSVTLTCFVEVSFIAIIIIIAIKTILMAIMTMMAIITMLCRHTRQA